MNLQSIKTKNLSYLKNQNLPYLNSNSDKIINNYKISTIQRLKELGYNNFIDIDKCRVLTTYFLLEKDINPFKTSSILLDYVSKKRHLNPSKINYWIDLVDYQPSRKLKKVLY